MARTVQASISAQGQRCTPFLALTAGRPNVNTLVNITNCDDCHQLVDLPRDFIFMWLGTYPVTKIYVTANGYINIDKDTNPSERYTWDGSASPIAAPASPAARGLPSGISVAHEDLHPSATAGAAVLTYFDELAGSFTVSYQNVTFWTGGTPQGNMNVQAVLWTDGTIDIRWGK